MNCVIIENCLNSPKGQNIVRICGGPIPKKIRDNFGILHITKIYKTYHCGAMVARSTYNREVTGSNPVGGISGISGI